jgi:hypothetical protein
VPVISAHALLAITGLGLWGYYLFSESTRLAWAAVALLAVVATLGLIMASRWIVVYRTHRTPRLAVAAAGAHSAPGSFFNPAARIRPALPGTPAPGSPGLLNGISRCRSSSRTASSPPSRSCSSC